MLMTIAKILFLESVMTHLIKYKSNLVRVRNKRISIFAIVEIIGGI